MALFPDRPDLASVSRVLHTAVKSRQLPSLMSLDRLSHNAELSTDSIGKGCK
jgi:hypothetical protein